MCNRSIAPTVQDVSKGYFRDGRLVMHTEKRSLVVTKSGSTNKCRYNYRLHGFSPEPYYYTYQTTLDAMEMALKERKFFVSDGEGGFCLPPRPESDAYFANQLTEITRFFNIHCQYTSTLNRDQFLDNYEGRRRHVYEKAFESLLVKPLSVKDSHTRYFVKVEKICKPQAVPRGIDPRDPRYHVNLGVFIRAIEKLIFKTIDKMFGSRTIYKGLNAKSRGKHISEAWNSFKEPVAIGLDASRFDQHVSTSALKWEHNIYRKYFPNNKLLKKLLSWQLSTKGVGYVREGNIKFGLTGGRCSGDMNTALGNCLLMSSMVFAYIRSKGVDAKLANDGDDCVVFLEKKDLNKFMTGLSSWFLTMGFNMTIEKPVYEIEHIEFCQSNPIWTEDGYIMVRNIHKALAKDCLSIKPLDNINLARRWMAAIGEGGIALAGQIPIWQELYNKVYKTADGAKPLTNDPTQETGLRILARGMKRSYGSVHPKTRASFYQATGILPDLQVAIEHQLNDLQFSVENVSVWDAIPMILK